MPQTASAKKALRASQRRRTLNDRWRDKLRFLEAKFRKAVTGSNTEEAQRWFLRLQSTLGRMARRHVVHRNTAARRTSRLSARLRTLSAPPTSGSRGPEH